MTYQNWLSAILITSICSSSAFAMGKNVPSEISQSTAVISDSLVKDLKCSTLSKDTVLSSLQPDAFDARREIPLENWTNTFGIGRCWSLSHAQRIMYYLGRFSGTEDPRAQPFASKPSDILDMFLGSITIKDQENEWSERQIPAPYKVFTAPTDYKTFFNSKQSIDILERYQEDRFTSPLNLRLLLGRRDREKSDNAATFATIQADLSKGRAPLVVLRVSRTHQHVLMVKRIHVIDRPGPLGDYRLDVYDSNRPGEENHITYSNTEQEFYAPDAFRHFKDETPYAPVGIFVVDEDDMDNIQETLLMYYTNRCQAH